MKSFLQFYWRLFLRGLANLAAPRNLAPDPSRWERTTFLLRRAGLKIGRGTIVMPGMEALVSLHHMIILGDHCVIGPMVKLWAFHRLEIGACTVLGPECSLANGSHDPNSLEPSAAPLSVGRGCRIGHGVRIVRGVRIGDLAVIEPGSVVTADVEEASVVAGVPAKRIAQREVAAQEHLWGDRWFDSRTFQPCPPPASQAVRD